MKHQTLPLVSVIIPFLNEEKFLTVAIESVLRQDYSNWELLLVDDGSIDKSTSIAKDYTVRYPGKIRYCEHEGHINKGLSPSRNEGIRHSRGTLMAFLDADDVWLPGKLSNQISIFKKYPDIAMIIESSEYWYNWNNKALENKIVPIGAVQNQVYNPPELVFELYPLSKGVSPCPSGLMITKDACERSGGFEETFIREYGLYEDQAFLHKIYLNEKIFVSGACNNLYRQRPGSIVSSVHASGKYLAVRQFFLEWLKEYLNNQDTVLSKTKKKELSSLIKKTLLPFKYPGYYSLFHVLPRRVLNKVKRMISRIDTC